MLKASVYFLLLSNPVPCRSRGGGGGEQRFGFSEYLIVSPLIYEPGIYGLLEVFDDRRAIGRRRVTVTASRMALEARQKKRRSRELRLLFVAVKLTIVIYGREMQQVGR